MYSPTWRVLLRIIAVLSWITSILWLFFQPGFEPLLAFLTGTAAFITSFAPPTDTPIIKQESLQKPLSEQNRLSMLTLVESIWVEGILFKSQKDTPYIELEIEEHPNSVEYPWNEILKTSRQSTRIIAADSNILDIYKNMSRAMLILGEPGSGKTTLLLELARETIELAKEDSSQPIPVVFNLSSWSSDHHSIEDWIINELNSKYYVPRKIAETLIENNEILLLLDGLDEVTFNRRSDCVKAINNFRSEQGFTPIVICSRTSGYEDIEIKLTLNGAIMLKPLSNETIFHFINNAGFEYQSLGNLLQRDSDLLELARTPLFLNIMLRDYGGIIQSDPHSTSSLIQKRENLIKAYVQRMFEHRRSSNGYQLEQSTEWLAWLAGKMAQHGQSVFLLEQMQPSWLSTRTQKFIYVLLSRLIPCLALMLIVLFTLTTFHILVAIQLFGIFFFLGLGIGFADIVRSEIIIRVNRNPRTKLMIVMDIVLEVIVISLLVGLFSVIWNYWYTCKFSTLFYTSQLNCAVEKGIPVILLSGVIGLLLGFRGRNRNSFDKDIQTFEAVNWSWKRAWRVGRYMCLAGIAIGTFYGIIISRGVWQDLGLLFLQPWNLILLSTILVLIYIASYGIIFGLIGMIISGPNRSMIGTRTYPNQGIWISLMNSLGITIFSLLLIAMFLLFFNVLIFPLSIDLDELWRLLPYVFIFAVSIGLWFGGLDVIQYITLRIILSLKGYCPLKYVDFLNFISERTYLKNNGGGYIFVHNLVMDYFIRLESNLE